MACASRYRSFENIGSLEDRGIERVISVRELDHTVNETANHVFAALVTKNCMTISCRRESSRPSCAPCFERTAFRPLCSLLASSPHCDSLQYCCILAQSALMHLPMGFCAKLGAEVEVRATRIAEIYRPFIKYPFLVRSHIQLLSIPENCHEGWRQINGST